jgi:hypothetical protein
MSTVVLHLREQAFQVDRLMLCQASGLFADGAVSSPYRVQTDEIPEAVKSFIAQIEDPGYLLSITRESVQCLSQLCGEFGCAHLSSERANFLA